MSAVAARSPILRNRRPRRKCRALTKNAGARPAFFAAIQAVAYAADFHWPSAAKPLALARSYTVCWARA
ncbi:hypothetical protein [Lysobacter gummosus]|uniref:hypothetical protein n=1 Tax=Lysobacter gummosus TaxID=262324 RepID=UPI0036394D20